MEGVLYPQNPRSAQTTDALREAFEATWVVVQARDPFRDFERDFELRAALSRKLKLLASEGVSDPIELREWALESFLLS
jgi:hypothetical protein